MATDCDLNHDGDGGNGACVVLFCPKVHKRKQSEQTFQNMNQIAYFHEFNEQSAHHHTFMNSIRSLSSELIVLHVSEFGSSGEGSVEILRAATHCAIPTFLGAAACSRSK